jgi:hypothetical protein
VDRSLGYALSMTTLTTRPLQPLLSFMAYPDGMGRATGVRRG